MPEPTAIDPVHDLSDPFNARYDGICGLGTCDRDRKIQQGDVSQYVQGHLMHMTCARRIVRGHAAPLCQTCWLYHNGPCDR